MVNAWNIERGRENIERGRLEHRWVPLTRNFCNKGYDRFNN